MIELLRELKKYFGEQVKYDEVLHLKGIPIYMAVGRRFYHVQISKSEFLVVELPPDDKYGVIALKKQLQRYQEVSELNVAYAFDGVTYTQREALIKANIPFISLPGNIYIPFL